MVSKTKPDGNMGFMTTKPDQVADPHQEDEHTYTMFLCDTFGTYFSPQKDEIEVITHIKRGITAAELFQVINPLKMPQEQALKMLGIAKSTAASKLKSNERLTPEQSERVLGFASMIQLVFDAVFMSNPEAFGYGFDERAWLEKWISTPLPAINNRIPADLLDTMSGQALITKCLNQSLEGVYA